MRCWTYSYKTPDGLRHEAEMSAPTKDDVYAALRERGIRAIRVTERIAPVVRRGFRGLRKRDWSLIAAGIVLLAALAAVVGRSVRPVRTPDAKAVPTARDAAVPPAVREIAPCTTPAYLRLAEAVESLRESQRRALESVDVELLANYALLEHSADVSRFREEIAKGRRIVAASRKSAKELFSRHYAKVAAGGASAQLAAQRLYGLLMDEIDAAEEQFGSDECAIELLDTNRGTWRVVRGAVKWDDPTAESQFEFFRRNRAGEKNENTPLP